MKTRYALEDILQSKHILAHKLTVYVPEHEHAAAAIAHLQDIMTDKAGGSTAINGTGTYKRDDGTIDQEHVTLIYCSFDSLEAIYPVMLAAYDVKSALNQETLAIELDGKMILC